MFVTVFKHYWRYVKAKRDSVLKMFLMQFTSPVVILLLVAAIACFAVLQEPKEGVSEAHYAAFI